MLTALSLLRRFLVHYCYFCEVIGLKMPVKKFSQFLLLIVFLGFTGKFSQLGAQDAAIQLPDNLFHAFVKGSSSDISRYFHESVTLEILNQSGVYNQRQAERLLSEFLTNNKVDQFTIRRSGRTGATENIYTIAEMRSGLNLYRVYLVRSLVKGEYLIYSLSISKI